MAVKKLAQDTIINLQRQCAIRELPEWNITKYSYFAPIPTRYRDNDMLGNLQDSVYYDTMLTISQRYLRRYVFESNGDGYEQLLTRSHFEYRKNMTFPQIILAGLGIKEFKGMKVEFTLGLFAPMHLGEVENELTLPPAGCFLDADRVEELKNFYESEASVVGQQVAEFHAKNIQTGILSHNFNEALRRIKLGN
ncbi:unnamed protein product [Clavelina lepadiformis]|uniref:Uncharacterized protein n=1 Tax=Clavelina lepadiformis TaxID=159417 RepID=A0ABP0FJ13_CLALP